MEALQFFSAALFRIKGSFWWCFFPPPQDVFLPASCHLPPFEVRFTSCWVSRWCFRKGVLLLCLYTSWLFKKAACYRHCDGGRLQELPDGHHRHHHHQASTWTHARGLAELFPIHCPCRRAFTHQENLPQRRVRRACPIAPSCWMVLVNVGCHWGRSAVGPLLPREAHMAS